MAAGRLTALTPEVHAAVVASLADGLPRRFAAQLAGVDERTLYRWAARGRHDLEAGQDTVYSRFCQDVKKAEAAAIASRVRSVKEAAEGDDGQWQAAAWWLERRYPEYFGRDPDLGREFREFLKERSRAPGNHPPQTPPGQSHATAAPAR